MDEAQRLSPFHVFRNRNFTLIWSAQLVSTIGSALTSLAASIYVFRLTNSALSVGLMLMATAAPSLLVGLFAGVFVDRYDRKWIMILSDAVRAVLVFLIPFLVPFGVGWLYVIVALTSAIGQFFDPAHESVLPEVATDRELAAANSLIAISSFGSTAIGFAASGLIASAASIDWAFYIDAVTFLISALCISSLHIARLPVQEETNVAVVVENLRAGMRQLFATPILRSLFVGLIPVLLAFGLANALLLPFAVRALGATEFEYGLQEGLTSVGFVVGSLLMAALFDRMREGSWLAVSFFGMALVNIVYSFLHSIPLAILVITFSGFFNAPSAVARRVIVQRNSPREMRGRVTSVFFVSRDVLFLLGMAAAGLADLIDVRLVYLASALILLVGGFFMLVLPGLRQERLEWQRALGLLRAAPTAAHLGIGRAAVPADFDRLVGLFPSLSGLTATERRELVKQSRIHEVPTGSTVIRRGEKGDAAFFVLDGRFAAGITSQSGTYRSLENMGPGTLFGEIALLTGAARSADVVATEDSTALQVSAKALKGLMGKPALGSIILAKMTERLSKLSLDELPRFGGMDQQVLRDLRTAQSES
jgi:MFS family permease